VTDVFAALLTLPDPIRNTWMPLIIGSLGIGVQVLTGSVWPSRPRAVPFETSLQPQRRVMALVSWARWHQQADRFSV